MNRSDHIRILTQRVEFLNQQLASGKIVERNMRDQLYHERDALLWAIFECKRATRLEKRIADQRATYRRFRDRLHEIVAEREGRRQAFQLDH